MSSSPPSSTRPRAPLPAEALRAALVGPGRPLARLEVVEESTSTNDDLARLLIEDPDRWPVPALLVAEHQSAGRGRIGRTWNAPARAALLCSYAFRPDAPAEALSWVPLLAGFAVVRALRACGAEATVKWPNDVLLTVDGTVDGWGTWRKVAGVLTRIVPEGGGRGATDGAVRGVTAGGGVVVGIGLNVSQTAAELPVGSATSLALARVEASREQVLVAVTTALVAVMADWQAAGGDVRVAGLDRATAAVCATLGSRVRVDLVGGGAVLGEAVALDEDGALLVRDDAGQVMPVRSGDVHHVRGTS